MAEMIVRIDLDNAAFEEGPGGAELARIFRVLAEDAEEHGNMGPLRGWDRRGIYDVNGNRVGNVTLKRF